MGKPIEINAIFKGGGAKGVAYAGALEALERRNYKIRAVAGSSAGALTAALVAAGYGSSELRQLAPDGLKAAIGVRPVLRAALRLGVTSSMPLHKWVEARLSTRVSVSKPSVGVSFEDLAVTETQLFVVAMDLSTRAPLVFSSQRTPGASVSAAVVASCAIPGFFSPGRALVESDGSRSVRALVDGGTWANFPDFVFCDPDFRDWYGLDEKDVKGIPTYGFVLNHKPVPGPEVDMIPVPASLGGQEDDLGVGSTSSNTVVRSLARTVGSIPGRSLLLLMALLTVALITNTLALAGPAVAARFSVFPTSIALPATILAVAAVATALFFLLLAALFTACLGSVLLKVVVPSVKAALGPATDVAPWKGRMTVRLISVPAHISTFNFWLKPQRQSELIADACRSVDRQLLSGEPEDASQPAGTAQPQLGLFVLKVFLWGAALGLVTYGAWMMVQPRPAFGAAYLTVFGVGLTLILVGLARSPALASVSPRTLLWRGIGLSLVGVTLAATCAYIVLRDADDRGHVYRAVVGSNTILASGEICYSLIDTRRPTQSSPTPGSECRIRTGQQILRTRQRLRPKSVVGVYNNKDGTVSLVPSDARFRIFVLTFGFVAAVFLFAGGVREFLRARNSAKLAVTSSSA